MEHPAPIEALPEAAHKPLRGPAPLRMMVARGMAPLPPLALVSALYALAYDADANLASTAQTTLGKLPAPVLNGALDNPALPAPVLDDLATRLKGNGAAIEKIVQHANTAAETVARISDFADEALCELIATNEQRLLEFPAIIEALYMNRALRMSTADRMIELAARNGIELKLPGFKEVAASLRDQLIPEPGEESPADDMFRDAIREAEEVEQGDGDEDDVVERDDEGKEELKDKFKKVERSLGEMTMSEKVRIALIGTRGQRALLVRSTNRVVAQAAISSPKVQESDAIKFAGSRQVHEDVLRFIAAKRDWVRMHQVKVNLCFNPKTPVSSSLKLVPHLREIDIKHMMRSRDVPMALKTAVTQLANKRKEK